MHNDLFVPKGNWDNHKILLYIALMDTNSSSAPILELGCGEGSSPTLQDYVKNNHRELISYDFHEDWAAKYGAHFVKDWDTDVDWNKKYSVALVDESPGEQRHKSIMLLKNVCDIVVVHDSEPSATGYLLDKIWPLYKYKVDLVSKGAWATAMSNTHDVSKWAELGLKFDDYEIKPFEERDNIAFCCVAFGEAYVEQQKRLRESILNVYPNSKLFFWTDELPEGSKSFYDSMYGFKVHAIQEAKDYGYKKVVFFDPACILQKPFPYTDEFIKRYGVLAAKDDTMLVKVVSDKCLEYFKTNRESLIGHHSVGGSFYYFDFNQAKARLIFEKWKEAEENNIFGSQQEAASEQLQGHVYDEACMALCLYQNDSEPIGVDELSYNQNEDDVIIKKHFK